MKIRIVRRVLSIDKTREADVLGIVVTGNQGTFLTELVRPRNDDKVTEAVERTISCLLSAGLAEEEGKSFPLTQGHEDLLNLSLFSV